MLRLEFGDEWVNAGYSLPSRQSVVLLSLLFPGLGQHSLHDSEGATGFFIAGLVAWIVCLTLTSWFFLFGIVFLGLPFLHIAAARAAGERWDLLQGYDVDRCSDEVVAHTVHYGPDGPSVSETRFTR